MYRLKLFIFYYFFAPIFFIRCCFLLAFLLPLKARRRTAPATGRFMRFNSRVYIIIEKLGEIRVHLELS